MIWGSSLLNIQAFLSDHIHQHIRIMISIVKGTLCSLFMSLSGFSHVGMMIPICAQQFLANEHLKTNVAIFLPFVRCRAQTYDSKCMFFLLNKLLVLSLFLRSQKNTLCFCWHEDCQIHLNEGGPIGILSNVYKLLLLYNNHFPIYISIGQCYHWVAKFEGRHPNRRIVWSPLQIGAS
jgi:hypothetical protein